MSYFWYSDDLYTDLQCPGALDTFLAGRWFRHPLALHITLRLWSHWWGNLLSLPLPICNGLAPGPTGTPQLTMGNSNGHLPAPQTSPPTIPAYKLDQNCNTQPLRIHIQSMDGTKIPLTWSQPCSSSDTPKIDYSKTDHWSIQQCLIHTRQQTALHLCTTNYRKTPSANCKPQWMASPIPGWTTLTHQYSETRTPICGTITRFLVAQTVDCPAEPPG